MTELALLGAGALLAGGAVATMRRSARALARRSEEAAAAARDAEARARQLFDGSPSVQLLLDARSGAVVEANPAAQAFYGWAGDVMRRRRVGHVAGISRAEFQALAAALAAAGPTVVRQRHRRRDRDVCDVEVFLSGLTVGGRPLIHATVYDVSERARADAALGASEARFRAAIEGSADAFFILTPVRAGDLPDAPVTDFLFAEVNARGAALLGTFADDLVGAELCRLFPLARDGGIFARCAAVLADGEPVEFEHVPRDPRTQARWLSLQVSPVRERDGAVVAVAMAARDVTAVKAAQVRVRDSEARYRLLFEQSPGPAWVYDVESLRFLAVNPAAERLYGWRADEFLALTLADLHADVGPDVVAAWVRAAGDRPSLGVPRRHRTRDGRELDVFASSSAIDYNGRRARMTLVEDVTERKRAEDAAREGERRFRGVLENLRALALTLDCEGRVTFINDAFLALTGWRRDEVLGEDYFTRFVPDGHEIGRVFRDTVGAGEADALPGHYENQIVSRGGEHRLVAWDNVVLRDGGGRVTGTASVGQDVTAQRAYEARLTELSEHDDLTGLLNRRGFRRTAEHEARVVTRTHRRDAVLCLDLDRFKAINDTFGHAEGDAALRAVAGVLRATVRESDVAARLGGDEFAVYAIGLRNAGEGEVLAGRLRDALAAHNARAAAAGRPYEISFTVAAAELEPGDALDDALARADAALYAAKPGRRGPGVLAA